MRPDGQTQFELTVCDSADWSLFERIACLLEVELDGSWTAKVDGLDERYWDLEVEAQQLTLHLQHFLGITLYLVGPSDADPPRIALLQKAADLIESRLGAGE